MGEIYCWVDNDQATEILPGNVSATNKWKIYSQRTTNNINKEFYTFLFFHTVNQCTLCVPCKYIVMFISV